MWQFFKIQLYRVTKILEAIEILKLNIPLKLTVFRKIYTVHLIHIDLRPRRDSIAV